MVWSKSEGNAVRLRRRGLRQSGAIETETSGRTVRAGGSYGGIPQAAATGTHQERLKKETGGR